ncbi:hypothetical protein BEE12_16155 [Pantoea agglomerans]|uniref:replication protein n=1 Tax=Enterobacter agglomerans TaxID=549 RepID=UPI00083D062B|nr:replication protein [Pantoea agglomerans]AOE41250.1 hypothetical protein BEE12_16155 [Pantoea agglomerans]
MNVAYVDFSASHNGNGPTVEKKKEGFTMIPNDVLDAVICSDFTARQLKVFQAIVRKTLGYGKDFDRITNTQIAEMTGIHHTHVCTAKNEMVEMNVLLFQGNKIGINTDVNSWNESISQISKTLAKSANKTLAESAKKHLPSQLNTKERNKINKNTP